jgi:hypothetical protein
MDKKQQYYLDNKEALIEYSRQYRKDNKEKIAEQKKEYRQNNKLHIKYHNKAPCECECGSIFRLDGKAKHCRTKKHIEYINNAQIC